MAVTPPGSTKHWDSSRLSQSELKAWEALAFVAKNDLFTFTKYFLGKLLLDEQVHRSLCRFVMIPYFWHNGEKAMAQALAEMLRLRPDWSGGPEDGQYRRVTRMKASEPSRQQLIMLPRSTFKTTILGEALPIWLLIRDPNAAILVASMTDQQSKLTLNAIQNQLLTNNLLDYFWGTRAWLKSECWTVMEKFIAARTKVRRDPSIWGTSVRSFKPSFHFNYAIVDDPIDLASAKSPEYVAQTDEFFAQLGPVLSEAPRLLWVIGTPWLKFDVYDRMFHRKAGGEYVMDAYIRALYNPDGSLWYPGRYPEERISELRAQHAHEPWIFQSQYLMLPVSENEQTLQDSRINWIDRADIPPLGQLFVLMAVDPADARGEGSSSWAVWVLGTDASKNFWDLAAFRARADAQRVTQEIVTLCRQWQPKVLCVESTVISKNWIDATLVPALRDNGIGVKIEEVRHGGRSKADRIRGVENGLGAVIASGRLYARRDNYVLQEELRCFPATQYSFDLLDAGAYAVRLAGERQFFPRQNPDEQRKDMPSWLRAYYQQCDEALRERDRKPRVVRFMGGRRRVIRMGA